MLIGIAGVAIFFAQAYIQLLIMMFIADCVVSMGGYNTMCEIVSARRPSLILPRSTPRQEQAIRARRGAP